MFNVAIVGNIPGNVLHFFLSPKLILFAVFVRFPRPKLNFEGPKFWTKQIEKRVLKKYIIFFDNAQPNWLLKVNFFFKQFFLNICAYMRSPKSRKIIVVVFRCFFNFGSFFGPFLGMLVKNAKVAPGIYLPFCNQSKNSSVYI